MRRIGELFLGTIIVFGLLWVWDDYLAFLLTLVFVSIVVFILLIALIAELLDRSKVPRTYFYGMLALIVAPLIPAVFYYLVYGQMSWLE